MMDYLKNAGRSTAFKSGKPGIEWLSSFESRWKAEQTRRVGQPLPANRAFACNSDVVDDFLGN